LSKYQFSNAQRYAIWQHYGQACYWCDEPLRLKDATVDHVIPEYLQDKHDEFKRLQMQYGLPATFAINDYCNWLPAHDRCNKNKSGKPLKPCPMVMDILEKLQREAESVRKIEMRVKANVKKDKLLGHITAGLQSKSINEQDLASLIADLKVPVDEDIRTLQNEVHLHIDPTRWRVVRIDGRLATVTDGQYAGVTPVEPNPHHSWWCPYCGSNGPWDGVRCLSCGRVSDPYD
jgi:hypothetical protein